MTIHPLTEAVARRIAEKHWDERTGPANWFVYVDDANAAIRAVLTFEPTEKMILEGTDYMGERWPPEDVYRAMTAALLREVENG